MLARVQKDFLIISIIVGSFLFFNIATIEKYGLDYDAGIHMVRGEVLLHFYRTGETEYKDLPDNERCRFQFPDSSYYYQIPGFAFKHYQGGTSMGSITSAVTCLVFYKYLNLLDPVDAHNMASVIFAAMSILILYLFAWKAFGRGVAIFSSLFLALYPPFIGYSHVCIKDIPVFFFVSMIIWTFWKGVTGNNYKWVWLSIICTGLGCVSKMNAIFAIIILAVWILVPVKQKTGIFAKLSPKFWISLILSPFVVIMVFLLLAPRIWHNKPYDIIGNMKIVYGEMVGISSYVAAKDQKTSPNVSKKTPQNKTTPTSTSHSNLLRRLFYAPMHALITMPLAVLLFSLIGIWQVVTGKSGGEGGAGWLALIWATVPVFFCMLPFVFIHSAIREFLPFISGVCLLAGLGANASFESIKNRFNVPPKRNTAFFLSFLVLATIPEIVSIIQYHPYELGFINRLVGGLKGAQKLKLPGSTKVGIPQIGDTRGTSFRGALEWLDKHNDSPKAIIIMWATSSKFILMNNSIKIIPDGWDYSKKLLSDLLKSDFDTVYVIFNRRYWNLVHPLYGYCYNNLSPIYTAYANGAPISYIYRMSKEEFRETVSPNKL